MDLLTREYKNVNYVSGPLIFVDKGYRFSYNSILEIIMPNGEIRSGQVLETSTEHAIVQVLEQTAGLDVAETAVRLKEEIARIGVSRDMVGRIFNGIGKPLDGLPDVIPEKFLEITGVPINPVSRAKPNDFIQTGVSPIDGNNTLVRGQKLPIFSGSGLPANELAAQILSQSIVRGEETQFVTVFAAMGITSREAAFFIKSFEDTGSIGKAVCFMNLADDPTIERILTPRCALTVAEYLAFEHDYHVLVILTDMTNYCEALREISTAREEIPGRRGYPGYMYTDLASIYERAGRIKGKKGSVTQIPILTMPDDDITHPIADLTGYITEGQIVLSRHLHRLGVYPPIDVLLCLSRLMNNGIGKGKTREDHRQVTDQLYACYAQGRDLRRLIAIVGEEALSELDKKYLRFADAFEKSFIGQGFTNRTIEETLTLAWRLLSIFPESELRRINKQVITKYFSEIMQDGVHSPYYRLEFD
ncbi:MAG TPA: V-type ATP synthase subunit B [Candidatus Brocadiia bacterium]|nr:V-type ATP synthase subunit B [Planctomycetota bacterium]MDO8094356.1 V-type ATP synthase subunit B [Candidatus Brocadiales bacterium]